MLLGVICLAAYDHLQVLEMRREVAALKAQREREAPKKSDAPEPHTATGPAPAGPKSPGTDARRDIVQTEREIEREIAETRTAAKNAADKASESLTALQARLRGVQRRTKDLWPGGGSQEPAAAPDSTGRGKQ